MKIPIRVMLVDDHAMFRQGIRGLLEAQEGFEVVGEAGDGPAALEATARLNPDVVVMDVTMRGLNGLDTSARLLRDHPSVKVIMLSMHGHTRFIREALTQGASGYLLKEGAFTELVHAVRTVVNDNRIYLSPEVSHAVVDAYLEPRDGHRAPGLSALTDREREVLQAIAEGGRNREIARRLGVSTRTVENHRSNLARKLRTRSVADLVKLAVREGITPL